MIYRNRAFVAGLVVLLSAGLTMVALISPLETHSAKAQQGGECPNPQLIDEIEGTGSQESPPFNTTTSSFRVSYETTEDIPDAPFFLRIEGEDTTAVGDASREGSATGETFVNEPPGRYSLNINTTNGTQYTIRIEECGEGGEANPKEGKSGAGKDQPKTESDTPPKATPPPPSPPQPKANPSPPPQPKADTKSKTLMEAGGPNAGPVPQMPSGECPREFPVKRDVGCFR